MAPIEAQIQSPNIKKESLAESNKSTFTRINDLNITLMSEKSGGMAMVSRDHQTKGEIVSVNAGEIKEKLYITTTSNKKEEKINIKFIGK